MGAAIRRTLELFYRKLWKLSERQDGALAGFLELVYNSTLKLYKFTDWFILRSDLRVCVCAHFSGLYCNVNYYLFTLPCLQMVIIVNEIFVS